MDSEPEHALIEQAKRDPDAFGRLYDRYFPRIYGYVAARVGCVPDAEDVVAETFLRALRGLPRFTDRGEGSFAAWLFRIAHNLLDDARYQCRQDAHFELNLNDKRASSEPSPDDAVVDREQARALRELVGTLPARRKEVVILKFYGGLRNREIAAVLGLDERTVASHLYRALDNLRERYPGETIHQAEGRS